MLRVNPRFTMRDGALPTGHNCYLLAKVSGSFMILSLPTSNHNQWHLRPQTCCHASISVPLPGQIARSNHLSKITPTRHPKVGQIYTHLQHFHFAKGITGINIQQGGKKSSGRLSHVLDAAVDQWVRELVRSLKHAVMSLWPWAISFWGLHSSYGTRP